MEICVSNSWGTICHDSWGVEDARVVCRQLGYSTAGKFYECISVIIIMSYKDFVCHSFCSGAQFFTSAYFGQGSGTIALAYVQCSGRESSLLNCPHSPAHRYCYHYDDAGARCYPHLCKC